MKNHDTDIKENDLSRSTVKPLKVIGKSKSSGTKITFLPSKEIFSITKFSSTIIQKRMRELAFLNKGIKIVVNDLSQKKEKKVEFKFDGGLLEFVEQMLLYILNLNLVSGQK